MKRILSLLLALTLIFCLAACGNDDSTSDTSGATSGQSQTETSNSSDTTNTESNKEESDTQAQTWTYQTLKEDITQLIRANELELKETSEGNGNTWKGYYYLGNSNSIANYDILGHGKCISGKENSFIRAWGGTRTDGTKEEGAPESIELKYSFACESENAFAENIDNDIENIKKFLEITPEEESKCITGIETFDKPDYKEIMNGKQGNVTFWKKGFVSIWVNGETKNGTLYYNCTLRIDFRA